MNRIIEWVKTHRWETTSAALGVSLLVVIILLIVVVNSQGQEEPEATGSTTTSTLPDTTIASVTTLPEETGGEPPPSTTLPIDLAPGVTAVVIDNHPDARPQVGVNASDLLIETPVEGGLSRLTTIYGEEQPDLVGPVRSLRPVSADLLGLFQPVVFATGGQSFVTGAVAAAGVTIVTPDTSIGFQSLERPQPHHVFVSPSVDMPQGTGFEAPWAEGLWPGGDAATGVTVPVGSGVEWRFENEVYVRYQEGEPYGVLSAIDADLEPLTRDTLILLVAHQKSAGYTDSADADVPTFDVVGGGDLYVLHAGEVIEGTWFRANQGEGYTFTAGDGEPLPIPEGTLYLAIVPDDSQVTLSG